MALVFSKIVPSGLTNGILLPVVASASPGTLFHAVTATTTLDMIYLHAVNTTSDTVTLSVEFGGTGTEEFFPVSLTANEGLNLIIPGWPLRGSAATQEVRLFATATGEIRVGGWINRAT